MDQLAQLTLMVILAGLYFGEIVKEIMSAVQCQFSTVV